MNELSRDPIINVVHDGMKRAIRVALDNECLPAAVILILSGIDTMAFLGMPTRQQNVKRDDFVAWAERYVRFPCDAQLTGMDLYGARCGMLHQHGTESSLSRKGQCRQVVYMDKNVPEVVSNPEVNDSIVLVSVPALAEAFFTGVDRFLVDLFADSARAAVAEKRFRMMVHTLPRPETEG